MFASLALTKMDCNRIANYFLLPVLLGVVYSNAALYHRMHNPATDNNKLAPKPTASNAADHLAIFAARHGGGDDVNEELLSFYTEATSHTVDDGGDTTTTTWPTMTTVMTPNASLAPKIQMPSFLVSVDSLELVFGNVLVLFVFVQLCANLLGQKLVKMLK